ncbi:hypothetical protein [Thiolinea disciformis]|uniref:hypothetical protein n=1 Tax=Thiolinea disciformis TaxID=125614 RepID=UPI000687B4FF|nr:hypothetical protein [Thiolinea disciformis]
MQINSHRLAIGVFCIINALALASCTTTGTSTLEDGPSVSPQSSRSLQTNTIAALKRSDAVAARQSAQQLVLANPRSYQSHLLLGASHHLAGDPASLDLAISGYEAAKQFAGSNVWPSMLAGMAALQRQEPKKALDYFSDAVLTDPQEALAFEGLSAAAYASGRIDLAQAAAERARKLDPNSSHAWRMATLSAAGKGQDAHVNSLLASPPAVVPAVERNFVEQRSASLLRTAAIDSSAAPVAAASSEEPAPVSAAPSNNVSGGSNQLTVDVTLVLSDVRDTTRYGVNLLDSLQGIYSLGRLSESRVSATDSSDSVTFTRAIKTPDLAYNLNIFNQGKRYYEVIARPSLTAFTGEQSVFFVGEQLKIPVSGVNTAVLENIDVGVSLKITPSEVRKDGAKFRVEADRSFFSDQNIGKFDQGVTIFKQSVAATADVTFGETLILSGLSESIRDGQSSAVPILGDIPVANLAFRNETNLKRGRHVLILITPSAPATIARTKLLSPSLNRLIQVWDTVIEPRHGLEALTYKLQKSWIFTRAAADDIPPSTIQDPKIMNPLLNSLVN